MTRAIRSRRIFADRRFIDGILTFDENGIVAIREGDVAPDDVIDAENLILAPGFVDIHVHGALGIDFSEAASDEVLLASGYHLSKGTTSICPTVTASPKEATRRALDEIAQAMTKSRQIAGVHLEGPYLSPKQCGAQSPGIIRAPDADEYLGILRDFGDVIRRWSYAPELDVDLAFTKAVAERKIALSAGHTDATAAELDAAMRLGCRQITHLYSCTSMVRRIGPYRHSGVIEKAYLEKEIFVEAIADGHHLPPDLLRLIYQIKGADRVALVTDALRVCGTDETEGVVGETPYVIENGVCMLRDRTAFAGSVATADRLLRFAVEGAGIPLADAIVMLTETPAKMAGLRVGRLAPSYPADFVLLDDRLTVKAVYKDGQLV